MSDLLPDDVLTRPTKATFNGAFWSVHARAFAERWNGDGVDTGLVDPEQVRRAWVAEQPPPNAFALVQQAWLATEGARRRHHTPPDGKISASVTRSPL